MINNLYQILFLLFLIIIWFFDIKNQKHELYNKVFNIMYILLAVMVGFRYGVGVDTPNYMEAFSYIPKLQDLDAFSFLIFRFQPLYTLTNSICKTILDDFVLVQILHALLFYHSLYLLLKTLDAKKIFILFFFFCDVYWRPGMSAMREGYALAFCFYAMYYYLQHKWILYYLFVFIGFGYHTGAILFIIFPFLYIFKPLRTLNPFGFIFLLSSAFIAFSLLGILQNALDGISDGSVTRYTVDDSESVFSPTTLIRDVTILLFIFSLCYMRLEVKYQSIIYLAVLYLVIDFLSSSYLGILHRFSSHLSVCYYFAIIQIFNSLSKKRALSLLAVCIIAYQPIMRGAYVLFFSETEVEYSRYCSVFSSDEEKKYYYKRIRSADAADYIILKP